jgi:hypothetical protein
MEERRLGKMGSNPPCQMCGSGEHGMITRNSEGRMKGSQLICPITGKDEEEETPDTLSPPSQRYEIDLYKLAESIDFDPSKLPQIWENYETYGEGRFKSPETIHTIRNRLSDICDASWANALIRRDVHDQIHESHRD